MALILMVLFLDYYGLRGTVSNYAAASTASADEEVVITRQPQSGGGTEDRISSG